MYSTGNVTRDIHNNVHRTASIRQEFLRIRMRQVAPSTFCPPFVYSAMLLTFML